MPSSGGSPRPIRAPIIHRERPEWDHRALGRKTVSIEVCGQGGCEYGGYADLRIRCERTRRRIVVDEREEIIAIVFVSGRRAGDQGCAEREHYRNRLRPPSGASAYFLNPR